MKKVLYVILAVLLVAAFCTGCGAAFKNPTSTVTPNGALSPGDTVNALVKITIPGGSGSSIKLISPLEKPVWHVDVNRGGYTITSRDASGATAILPAQFVGIYNEEITLEITMTGNVGDNLKGTKFQAVTVLESEGTVSGDTTYSTPDQTVYDPETITKTIAEKETEITNLKNQMLVYSAFGIDVASSEDLVASAENYFRQAETNAKNNKLPAAFSALSNGESALTKAGSGISGQALDKIYADIDDIQSTIDFLIEKGRTNQASILSTKLVDVKSSYSLLNSEYNKNNVPDCTVTLQDAENLKVQSDTYLEEATSAPDFLQYWWVLLIVLGVALVVVGAVFLIKRRGGGWDELG